MDALFSRFDLSGISDAARRESELLTEPVMVWSRNFSFE